MFCLSIKLRSHLVICKFVHWFCLVCVLRYSNHLLIYVLLVLGLVYRLPPAYAKLFPFQISETGGTGVLLDSMIVFFFLNIKLMYCSHYKLVVGTDYEFVVLMQLTDYQRKKLINRPTNRRRLIQVMSTYVPLPVC